MIRHPHFPGIPWTIHWEAQTQTGHGRLWWLVVGITLLALFLTGVGVISGTLL